MAPTPATKTFPRPANCVLVDGQQSVPPFLRMPWSVRARIYKWSGILANPSGPTFINLNNQLPLPTDLPCSREARHHISTSHRLLLTCRTTYAEVSGSVYAMNFFYIRFSDRNSLGSLRNLTPTSMNALRLLTIHLNVVSCELGFRCDHSLEPWQTVRCSTTPDKPLSLKEIRVQTILQEWRRTCHECIRPFLITTDARLHLNFICDVADTATGQMAVQPLLDSPALLLAGCSIRLCHKRNSDLQELAEQVVAATTGSRRVCMKQGSTPFRYQDLPTEIQQKILGYTDLVTPFNEVEWNPFDGMYCRFGVNTWQYKRPREQHGRLTKLGKYSRMDELPYPKCSDHFYPAGCFCRSYHAVSSSVHSCTCWAPPSSLFLVSRLMTENARRVFYTSNKFVIVRHGEASRTVNKSDPQLPVSVWLNRVISEEALQYLRFLQIVLPPYGEDQPCKYCPSQSTEWLEWVSTLQRIAPKLDLPKLTIYVYFVAYRPGEPSFRAPQYRKQMTHDQSYAIQKCYVDIISPLKRLGLSGLRAFFTHLPNPARFSDCWNGGVPNAARFSDKYRDKFDLPELEQELETIVMGDGYDALAAGKIEREESHWLRVSALIDDRIRS
nr:hypothetical protein CFP56_16723 [Quercus suber]